MRLILLLQLLYAVIVSANTESFLLHVPSDFPVSKNSDEPSSYPRYISLHNSNLAKATFSCGIESPTYVELKNLQVDETYQIKICWTALDPVSVTDMDWIVIPHSTEFQNTKSDEARIFVKFNVLADSWPPLNRLTKIPINVSVINTKLGIPVDLYKIIIYIGLVMAVTFWINSRTNLYEKLKNL
ncbi:hypothetical protein ZYGR_0AV02280 [Zygosaccharomyces rouxii]|uniref:Uncharacterized protein n=1 Tax=Zygosaccharomyces rouxii TaxID=4956 RepID=A0A1Q3AIN3_ZYGRO|nr:hypothetical protein ZYGR_0AV02280 [Zygosaccharomyces rouxii]